MKHIKLKITAFLLGLVLVMQLNAAEGFTSAGKVVEVYPTVNGELYVEVAATSNPSGCTHASWFTAASGAGTSRVLSVLLTAKTLDKDVQLYVTGTCDQWGYSNISSVRMK